ncbi:MAG: hypothetical protein CAK86_03520 [Opitutia bacterium AMD-G1]|nr:MAG: hypothetical protein CAK86_03520 [Opitutae bacterium AMD-G1]
MNGFFVRQSRKYAVQSRRKRADEEGDLLVINPAPLRGADAPFQLFSSDLPKIGAAVVAVKAWHTTKAITPTMIKKGDLLEFVREEAVKAAKEAFADLTSPEDQPMAKILVLPGIPSTEPQRSESITLLRESGVDHVLTFRTILENLVQVVESNQSYAKSDTLQLLRLLRVYDMVKAAQLELFGSANPPK